jgi:hypothetical protein
VSANNFIDIYVNHGKRSLFEIKPSSVLRQWMNDTNNWAYNCLPLKTANMHGWVVYSPFNFTATWNGGDHLPDMTVQSDREGYVKSHFGHGIMTINTDFLIRTSPGISLYVRGVPNTQKDIIYPMDAIIETDWLPFHFPFSYKFIKPGTVSFEKDEPLFMFFPIKRDLIESFDISFKELSSNKELQEQNIKFSEARRKHMEEKRPEAQRFYIKGSVVDEKAEIYEHKTKIRLQEPRIAE